MEITELFKGVAIVVDDEFKDPEANIKKILDQITTLNIPVIKYGDIPSDGCVDHFRNLSFVLLDWRLIKIKEEFSTSDLTKGVRVPGGLEGKNNELTINFIKMINKVCYCPIFIFSNEAPNDILSILNEEGICIPDRPSNILIKSKLDLEEEGSLKIAIEEWIKINPSVYVLKEWEREYQECKNRLFFDFQKMSPVWPQVMWKCFKDEGGNKSLELGELISRNLHTRMKPFKFNSDLLTKTDVNIERDEMRKVLEGAKFLKELPDDDISTGDVFYEEYQEGETIKQRYWLNIRAQCDTVRGDDINLYCLPGCELIQNDRGKIKNIHFHKGNFLECVYHAIVPFIDNGKIIEFDFREFKVCPIKSLSTDKIKRIGRILHPYITKIQQRFAFYLHRQGLPRIPEDAIFSQPETPPETKS
ncbi:MAG: hypothetical protein KAT05_12925 [Spirochaetes bacterium]|nr:hypothetical protein [Spirochaetota bacterium]